VLMSIRVFRKTRHNVDSRLASQPVPDIKPEMRPGFVDIITVGCRNLRASGLASVERPFLEFVVPQPDEDEAKDKTRVRWKNEPENPNFLCRNLIPVNLPLLPVFAPTLRISAFDKSLGGLRTNQLGVAFVDLSAFISEPGAPEEEDVRNDSDDESTNNCYNSDTDADSVSTKHTEDEDDKERDFTDLSDTDFVDKEEAEMASFRKHQSVMSKLYPCFPANKVHMYMGDPDTGITRPHEIGSLENNHDLESFKSYEFLQGQGDGLGKRRVVGKWKGYVRVVYDEHAEPFLSLEKINNPETFQIRLYVLNASKLCCDGDMDPEPYIKASLGDQVHKGDWGGVGCTGPSPNLNQYFEFQTSLPGRSSLKVDVFDHNENLLMQDELIGSTIIDLEDRWFSEPWQKMGQDYRSFMQQTALAMKPLEERNLRSTHSRIPQGALHLWVDIVPTTDLKKYPPHDISLPPPEDWVIRVIIWKTINIQPNEGEDMIDMYVKCRMSKTSKWYSTDTHLRCKTGVGSFNYRINIPIKLPRKEPYRGWGKMFFNIFDLDVFTANEVCWQSEIDIADELNAAFAKQEPTQIFKEPGQEWLENSAVVQNLLACGHSCDSIASEKCGDKNTAKFVNKSREAWRKHNKPPWKKDGWKREHLDDLNGWTWQDAEALPRPEDVLNSGGEALKKFGSGVLDVGSGVLDVSSGVLDVGSGALKNLGITEGKEESKSNETEKTQLLPGVPGAKKKESKKDKLKALRAQKKNTRKNTETMANAKKKKKKTRVPPKKDSKMLMDNLMGLAGMGPDPPNSAWLAPTSTTGGRKKEEEKKDHEEKNCLTSCFSSGAEEKKDPEEKNCLTSCFSSGAIDSKKNKIAFGNGALLISIEVMSAHHAEKKKAGEGRSDPNTNPTLPPPEGRPDITKMWNPFYMISTLCGADVAAEFGCCLCLLISIVLSIYVGPLALDIISVLLLLPAWFSWTLFIGIIVFMCLFVHYVKKVFSKACSSGDDEEEEVETIQ